MTARARTRFQRAKGAEAEQHRVYKALVSSLAKGSHWKALGLTAGTAYPDFRAKVPLNTYEALSPAIEKMKKGQADVLWPGQCAYYAVSSGTTAGRTKYLPITQGMLEHFRKTGLDSLLAYTARTPGSKVFRGRHLFLGGATVLSPIPEAKPFQAWAGDLSGITAIHMPEWVDAHLYEPGREIAGISDWPAKIEAIAERTLPKDITLLAGIPSWILILAEALKTRSAKAGRPVKTLQQVWPNFECLIHGGVPIAPFADELREALGQSVRFHEVYPASEAFIACQDAEAAAGLRLFTNAQVFYEFLPMDDFDEARLPHLGEKAVPLAGVKTGVDYAILMTTPAGLARYVIGDVVRFISTEPPRLVYVGRSKLQLSAFGEHVIEKEITDVLTGLCRKNGWSIVNFHVAPLFVDSLIGVKRGRHEWWIELKPGTHLNPTGPQMAPELDSELQRLNDDYEAKRKGGGLDAPIVRLVMPGVFEQWQKAHGRWGGQNKMPRCRSDRQIADQLAALTHFAND